MRRREFITLASSAAAMWPVVLRAQPQPKMLRVGFVGIQPRESAIYAAFLERMAELSYEEGRNFTFEYIQAANVDAYEKSYLELAARKVDVFLAVGNEPALRAALSAAGGAPIAFLAIDFDPLAKGYVASLSRPGGNVTGIFVRQLELAAKRVEIAREVFPTATVVGIAFDKVSREQRDAAADAARKLGFEPHPIEVKGPTDYGAAFSAMDRLRGQPIVLPAGPMFLRDREVIAHTLARASHSFGRRVPREHCNRSTNELWLRPDRSVPRHRRLCPPDCARRQTIGNADRAIFALSHGGQLKNGRSTRHYFAGFIHCPRQRGNRVRRAQKQ